MVRRASTLPNRSIAAGVIIPPGDYPFNYMGFLFRLNDSRAVSGRGVTHFGDFWNGTWFQYGGAITWKTGRNIDVSVEQVVEVAG